MSLHVIIVYLEFGNTYLHVEVPDLQFARVQGRHDPRLGWMEGDALDPCAFGLEF